MKLVWLIVTCSMVVVMANGYQRGDGFPGYTGGIRFPEDEVIRWSETFSHSITGLVRNLTALDHLTDEYKRYSNIKSVNRGELRDNIATEIETLLQSKVENIQRLVRHAEDVYENYTFDQELDYDFLNSKKLLSTQDMAHNQVFSVEEMSQKIRAINLSEASHFNYMPVNNEISTVQVPTTVFDKSINIMNGAYWTKELESTFKHNYERNDSQTWQYFCSTEGFFRVFPGMKWPRDNKEMGIDFFDCRVRNWYLQGASGPKNVVILVDASGSMKGLRMIIAQSTVKQILNTLDDDDYFNIIRFSDEVKYVDPCFNGTFLMKATKENKRRLTELIEEEVEAENQADFGKALEEVFDLFDKLEGIVRNRHGALCNKAILLITDGVPEPHKTLFETRNWPDKRTRVFTFLIGRDVKDDRDVKWMACANKGYYSHISTLADVQENVQNYIKVLSRPMVINRDHNLVWTSLYLDHISSLEADKGLKFLTSVSTPVYDRKNETRLFDPHRPRFRCQVGNVFRVGSATHGDKDIKPFSSLHFREGNLLGVMGTDVPIELLQEMAPTYRLGVNGYAFLINHNGYVMFHPDYTPYRPDPDTGEKILNPNYSNMDLDHIILPRNPEEFREMQENMLEMAEGSKRITVLRPYDNMKRMVKRSYAFVYRTIMNNTFILGLALPTTFSERTNVAIHLPLREALNGSTVLIAPWRYCKSLDPRLKGKARVDKLLEIFENVSLREKDCDESLLADLHSDSVFTRGLHSRWIRNANNYRLSHGVELIFFGSKGGLTRYLHTKEGTTPRFLENKTSPIDSSYYRRSVESMERLASREEYNFTFSFNNLGPEGFNNTTTTVLVTAPVVVRDKTDTVMGVAGVVGLEMEYFRFEEIFKNSHYGFRDMNCSNPVLSCYLVDDHGYLMMTKFAAFFDTYAPAKNGDFFGQAEDSLMVELIRKKLFVRYNFTDYQGVCQIRAEDDSRSGAALLLNPLKWLFRGLLWTITELALLLTQFSFNDYYHRWKAFASDPSEADYFQEKGEDSFCDIDIADLDPTERLAFSQLYQLDCLPGNKVVGHRPCHHTFALYHVDFNKLIMGPLIGYIEGDEMLERCPKGDVNCSARYRPDKVCRKRYAVSRINDTNLLSIVTSSDCHSASFPSFGLEHEEVLYPSYQQCAKRKKNRYRKKRRPCSDFSYIEDWRKCAGCVAVLSKLVLSAGLLFALLCT